MNNQTPNAGEEEQSSKGAVHMTIGCLVFLVGAAFTLIGLLETKAGGGFLIFWGAIVFGLIQFIVGTNMFLNARRKRRSSGPFKDAPLDFRILLRAMVAATEHQGSLDDQKIARISPFLNEVYGKEYDVDTIAAACRALSGEGQHVMSYLVDAASQLSPEFRWTIVRASAMVLGSASTGESGSEFLLHMSRALRLPDYEFAKNVGTLTRAAGSAPQRG
jgi:hypothetical protein